MSRCVCLGLGAYLDAEEVSGSLYVEPCDSHPLPTSLDDSAAVVAGLRVDRCLEAIAEVRDLLWPEGRGDAPWPSDRIEDVARALDFLRPGGGQGSGAAPAVAAVATGPSIAVTLHRLDIRDVDVEMPVSCPQCGLSFDREGSLIEGGYCATAQRCSVGSYEGRPVIDAYASTENVDDIGLVTGYQCAGCRTTLVSVEGRPPHLGGKAGA